MANRTILSLSSVVLSLSVWGVACSSTPSPARNQVALQTPCSRGLDSDEPLMGWLELSGLDNDARISIPSDELVPGAQIRQELPPGIYEATWHADSSVSPTFADTPRMQSQLVRIEPDRPSVVALRHAESCERFFIGPSGGPPPRSAELR